MPNSGISKPPIGWTAIIITAIITMGAILIGIFGITASFETLRLTTEKGNPGESPLNAVLQAQTTLLGVFVVTLISAAVGGVKLFRDNQKTRAVVQGASEKIDVIEKQTNGRTHHRDQAINVLVETLLSIPGLSTGSIQTLGEKVKSIQANPMTAEKAPEDMMSNDELDAQDALFKALETVYKLRGLQKDES